jgi:hypothetical protein
MTKDKHPGGRPKISEDEKEAMLSKLEPYLKSGLSLRKALLEAGIVPATFYRIKREDPSFESKIARFQQYLSVLLNSSIVKHLHYIVRKQAGYQEADGTIVPPKKLDKDDLSFMFWFGTNSNLTKNEYGNRTPVSTFDPEAELQKMKDMIDSELSEKLSIV